MIKPKTFLLAPAIALFLLLIMENHRFSSFFISILKSIIFLFLVVVPLLWILYINYKYDTLNTKYGRKLSKRMSIIGVSIVFVASVTIVLITQTSASYTLNHKLYNESFYFFSVWIITGLVSIAREIINNQSFYEKKAELNDRSAIPSGLLIIFGPVGLYIIHKKLLRILEAFDKAD